MHLAGQIGDHLHGGTSSTLLVQTHSQGKFVMVDFSAHNPSGKLLSFSSVLNSEGAAKPSTLSLSACCRIIDEHGGRLLQSTTSDKPAFRMELQVATHSAGRSQLVAPSRAAARSSS
jgi:hypothetical protein